jgi:hypothetical protein
MLCVKNAGDVADLKAVLADSLVFSPIGCHLLIKTNLPNFVSAQIGPRVPADLSQ